MIDPTKLVTPSDSVSLKEEFLLFCILAVGKNSDIAAQKLGSLLEGKAEGVTPFSYLRGRDIGALVLTAKTGQYKRVAAAISSVILRDVTRIKLEDLLNTPGIGPKSARFFLSRTREGVRFAVLDTHILKWARSLFEDFPESTPTSEKSYQKWESLCLLLMEAKFPGVSPAEADLRIWLSYSNRQPNKQKENYESQTARKKPDRAAHG